MLRQLLILAALTLPAIALAREAATTQVSEHRLQAIDAKSAEIRDMTADFEQTKHSALLAEPLVSSGVVRSSGQTTLWETNVPQKTRMRIDPKTLAILYVADKRVEEYPVEGNLSALAASPLPRLEELKKSFTMKPTPGDDLGVEPTSGQITLLLEPASEDVANYVGQIRVMLDEARGVVLALEVVDPDGEKTITRFTNIRTNTGLDPKRLELNAPADAHVVRPMGR